MFCSHDYGSAPLHPGLPTASELSVRKMTYSKMGRALNATHYLQAWYTLWFGFLVHWPMPSPVPPI